MNPNGGLTSVLFWLQPNAVKFAAEARAKWRTHLIWWLGGLVTIFFLSMAIFAVSLWQNAPGYAVATVFVSAVMINACLAAAVQQIFVRLIDAKARLDFAWQQARSHVSWYFVLVDVSYAGGQKLLTLVNRKTGKVLSRLVRDDEDCVVALQKFLFEHGIGVGDVLAVEVKAEFSNPLLVDGNYHDLLRDIQERAGTWVDVYSASPRELAVAATQFITDAEKIGAW